MTPPLEPWWRAELAELERQGLRRVRRTRAHSAELLAFASNDYLGLSVHPDVIAAAVEAAREWGVGSGASPAVTGRTQVHDDLETALAEFEGLPAALVFGSGYVANLATLQALVGPGDFVIGDKLNHASLIDGCRISGADFRTFRHDDPADLAKKLAAATGKRRRVVAVDSLYSMDGDLAPLREIAAIAANHDALLLVDEAHATGVFGARGRGLTEALDLPPGPGLLKMGTLSKALGSVGGFVAGDADLIEYLRNRARGYVYSTAPCTPGAAAALAAVRLISADPSRGAKLLATAAEFRDSLISLGFDVRPSRSQIVPIRVGDPQAAVALSATLQRAGLFVPAIRPPTVPPGTSRLRIGLSTLHTAADLTRLLAALETARPIGRA